MKREERGAAAPGTELLCQCQEAGKSFKARRLHGLNGISGSLIWQPCTDNIKGSKRLEARKLVERYLQTLISETMSLSQNRVVRTEQKDEGEKYLSGKKN